VAVSFSYDMTRWIYAVCVTFAPTALLTPGVVLSIRNIRAVINPADSLPVIGILAALGAFGGVLNKFPALTTSGSSTCFVMTASAGHQSMEVVILTDWREQFLRPYRMGRFIIVSCELLSPPLAWALRRSEWIRTCAQRLIVSPAALNSADVLADPIITEIYRGAVWSRKVVLPLRCVTSRLARPALPPQ
jgi:hypothetical protein